MNGIAVIRILIFEHKLILQMALDKDIPKVLDMLVFNTTHGGSNLIEWTRQQSIYQIAKFGDLGRFVKMGHHYSEVMPARPDVAGLDADDAESEWMTESELRRKRVPVVSQTWRAALASR
jgi:hypothetical protein